MLKRIASLSLYTFNYERRIQLPIEERLYDGSHQYYSWHHWPFDTQREWLSLVRWFSLLNLWWQSYVVTIHTKPPHGNFNLVLFAFKYFTKWNGNFNLVLFAFKHFTKWNLENLLNFDPGHSPQSSLVLSESFETKAIVCNIERAKRRDAKHTFRISNWSECVITRTGRKVWKFGNMKCREDHS